MFLRCGIAVMTFRFSFTTSRISTLGAWENKSRVFPCAERTYSRSSEREAECHHGDLAAEGHQSETRSNDSKDHVGTSFRRPFGRGSHSYPPISGHRRVECEYCPSVQIPAPAELSEAWVAIRAVYRRPHPEREFPCAPARIFQSSGLWRR